MAGEPAWRAIIPEAERRIYERAGFGHKGGLGKRPAVVIIDVQYRTVGLEPAPIEVAMQTYPTACGDAGWRAVEAISRILAAARPRGVPVLYPYVAPKEAYDSGRLGAKVPTILSIDAKGYEFVAEVAPRTGDILVPKKHPSAFFGTPMASYLIDLGVDTLLVTGCTTSGCVRSTVTDAFAYNFKVAVVEDAVYDRSTTSHLVNLFDMSSKYADVMDSDSVVAYLSSLPEVRA
ncbi:MAG: isochorismatase family protein [Firmicutes bacterium]|nr:isochorismatase family protein [Bacillota bacterium]